MITWRELEPLAMRLALGEGAVHARAAGEWFVIVDCWPPYASGRTITGPHREHGRATIEALRWAVMRKTSGIGKRLASAVTAALTAAIAVVATMKRCPRCGARKVVRVSFGTVVLGHSCRACKWEKPG